MKDRSYGKVRDEVKSSEVVLDFKYKVVPRISKPRPLQGHLEVTTDFQTSNGPGAGQEVFGLHANVMGGKRMGVL